MSLITWSSMFEVGVAEIDAQHKQLIVIINSLHQAMLEQRSQDALSGVLSELESYTSYHFSTEERLMQQHGYPNEDRHRRQHLDGIDAIAGLRRNFDAGQPDLADDTMRFLRDWLTQHILRSDKHFCDSLQSRVASGSRS